MASRILFAVVCLALVSSSLGAMAVVAVTPESTLASITAFQSANNPNFAKIFAKTKTPQFLLDNFKKHAYKFTLFYPTDAALKRYQPTGKCANVPMSNVLAQLMVPIMYTGAELAKLPRGTKLRTMSPVYLTILGKDTKGRTRIGIVNGYQKVVAWATVIKTDVLVNQRNFVMHQIDNIISACDDGMPVPGV